MRKSFTVGMVMSKNTLLTLVVSVVVLSLVGASLSPVYSKKTTGTLKLVGDIATYSDPNCSEDNEIAVTVELSRGRRGGQTFSWPTAETFYIKLSDTFTPTPPQPHIRFHNQTTGEDLGHPELDPPTPGGGLEVFFGGTGGSCHRIGPGERTPTHPPQGLFQGDLDADGNLTRLIAFMDDSPRLVDDDGVWSREFFDLRCEMDGGSLNCFIVHRDIHLYTNKKGGPIGRSAYSHEEDVVLDVTATVTATPS